MPDEYTADGIESLTLRESVRRRPGMYAGDTATGDGALHLVLEVLSNAVDQVMLGRCTRVDIRVDADDLVTISDDGPGIPAHGLVALLERPSNRPTVDGHRPHVHLSPIGLGLPVSNALSDPFEVDTVHAGVHASVRYAGGLVQTPLQVRPATRPSGTAIRLRPDPHVFAALASLAWS
ncbi:MAG TPA: ATP-binding protein [Nannocystis sp.]|jgi:DNA gyrase subunit B